MSTTSNPLTSVTRSEVAARTRRDRLGAVLDALRSEWIKLSTLRSTPLIVGLTALISAAVAAALAATATDDRLLATELFIYPLPLVAMSAAVAGILMFTTEAQHGTLQVMLIARPARWVIVTAKTVMVVLVGMGLGIVGMACGFVGAALGGVAVGDAADLVTRSSWALLYIVLAAVIGLGIGMIVRHSAGAISGLLMWSFVVESLFAPALPDGVVHFLPFSAGYRLLDAGPNFEAPVVIPVELARAQYALIFGGYAVIGLVVGTWLLYRRDAD